MAKLSLKRTGDFSKSLRYLEKLKHKDLVHAIIPYAQKGVDALKEATPKDTGYTAESWYSEIEVSETALRIYWKNSYINEGYPIAILIDIGHGTGTGGYVAPHPYIDKALQPIIEQINDLIKKEVTR